MNFEETALPGVLIIEPDVHKDDRGFFLETYHGRKYAKGGVVDNFVQDNHSRSTKGILRGLHVQLRRPQGKLVRALQGEIFDVAVDIRKGSPTFGQWLGVSLSGENFKQLYVPAGFAHGFCVVSDTAEVAYKCTDFYDPESEVSVLWNDPAIGIEWPTGEPILSGKDADGKTLAQLDSVLPLFK